MKTFDFLRGNMGASSGIASAHSSFQGKRMARPSNVAPLARRTPRAGLSPVAVAEVKSPEQRGEFFLAIQHSKYLGSPMINMPHPLPLLCFYSP
jgi:hypothetical protein